MFRTFAFLLLVASSLLARAECTTQQPEDFRHFFEKFAANKQFATSRTLYPLKVETTHHGIDANGKDISGVEVQFRSAQEDANGESLSVEMRRNVLSYKILSLSRTAAVVNVSGDGDGLLFNHHFIRKGNCWFQKKLENYSL